MMAAARRERIVPYPVFATYLLIVVNVGVFLLLGSSQSVYSWGANNQRVVFENGEYYRLLTSMFLHANVLHIAFNMLALYSLGRVLESYYGRTRFLLIYFLGGLCGSLASALLNDPRISSVGASGAVFALFGAEIVYFSRHGSELGEEAQSALRGSLGTVALNFFNGLRPDSGIDNWAHLGGLIGGGVVAYLTTLFFTLERQPAAVAMLEGEIAPETAPVPGQPGSLVIYETRHTSLFRLGLIVGVVALYLVLNGLMSFVGLNSDRTVQVSNLSVNVMGGWRIITDFDEVELCQQAGIECLIVGVLDDTTYFDVSRLRGYPSIEDFERDIDLYLQSENAQSISRESITIDGRAAVRLMFQIGGLKSLVIVTTDRSGYIRFIAQANAADFDRYESNFNAIAASLRIRGRS
jgi:membrane associated rhomboid family serine protease